MISAVDYLQAMRVRKPARLALDCLMKDYDALIGPTTATVAPPIDNKFSGYGRPFEGSRRTVSLTGPGNVVGIPAISVPNGFGQDGLPTAIQCMRSLWTESTLIQIAMEYQSRTEWHKQRPRI